MTRGKQLEPTVAGKKENETKLGGSEGGENRER